MRQIKPVKNGLKPRPSQAWRQAVEKHSGRPRAADIGLEREIKAWAEQLTGYSFLGTYINMLSLDANLLIADIASGDGDRRRQAENIISKIDHDTDVDVSIFISSLASKNDDVVLWSAIALEHLGERGCAAIPCLLELLHRGQLFLRQTAVKTLAAVGAKDTEARAAVFRSFADASPFVRREALQACTGFPNLSADDLTVIAAMATDPDEAVANWSEIALRNIRLNKQTSA